MPVTRRVVGEARRVAVAIAAWNSGELASAPGVSSGRARSSSSCRPRTRCRAGRRPPPTRSRRRASRRSSRTLEACAARNEEAIAEDDGEDGDGTAEAIDERSPAAEHRATPGLGLGGRHGPRWSVCVRTIENAHSPCQAVIRCVSDTTDVHCDERPFPLHREVSVPRITPEHEAAVRERIIRAALEVFAEKGYHGATIADVVRRSGPVGRRHLHVLRRQGGALPPDLRPDLEPRASRSSATGWRR